MKLISENLLLATACAALGWTSSAHALTISALTTGTEPALSIASGGTLTSSLGDGDAGIDANHLYGTTVSNPLRVGTTTGTAASVRALVIPFQLPNFGNMVDPFTSASFTDTVNFNSSATSPSIAANLDSDLYGLNASTSPTVTGAMYYEGVLDLTNATLLMQNFVHSTDITGANTTPVPVSSDTAGSDALLAYLNAQYDLNAASIAAGTPVYIFLRVSANSDTGAPVSSTDGGVANNFGLAGATAATGAPTITYGLNIVPEPTAVGLLGVVELGMLRRRRSR